MYGAQSQLVSEQTLPVQIGGVMDTQYNKQQASSKRLKIVELSQSFFAQKRIENV